MNCHRVNHLLSAYMDGELPGIEHRQVREHVLRCEECGTEYDTLLRMKRALGAMRIQEPRPDLPARILHHVAWESAQALQWQPANLMHRFTSILQAAAMEPGSRGLAAAFGVLVLVVGVRAGLTGGAPPPPDNIVWSPALAPVSTLTAGLQPSASLRFLPQPVNYSWVEPLRRPPIIDSFSRQSGMSRSFTPAGFRFTSDQLAH